MKKTAVAVLSLVLGTVAGLILFTRILPTALKYTPLAKPIINPIRESPEVVGFLPYWLITKADKDYTKYVTTLAYFGLTIEGNGSIQKLTSPTETEPGWYALTNGSANQFLSTFNSGNQRLALVAFSADEDVIDELISNPVQNARAFLREIGPVMKKYGFQELNLDFESVKIASESARSNFTVFVKEIRSGMDANNLGTLSIDVSPTALLKNYVINVSEIAPYVDSVIFMTYDYHYAGSYVTGPVSPLRGAGTESEFDTEVAMNEALRVLPPGKIIMGAPLYGYEWETLTENPRSAVLPGSGLAASTRRIETFLTMCSTCSAMFDEKAKEPYLVYKNQETGMFHQFFFPDKVSTEEKIKLAKKLNLRGLALWALGYEGSTVLLPLEPYISNP